MKLPVEHGGQGQFQEFKPELTAKRQAAAKSVIDYAKAVRDWEMLDQAVDVQIEDQQAFVKWWKENVTVRLRAGREMRADQRSSISAEKAEQLTQIAHQTVSKWSVRLKDLPTYRELLRGPSYRKAMGKRGSTDHRGASGTGENEWFTPPQYLTLAREVMGDFDLDPASSIEAQEIVQAKEFFTKKINGLEQEWHGRVWLNPPYAQPLIGEFVSKLCAEFETEHVSEAIMLTHNYTDTAWFHEAALVCNAICFTRGRVQFYKANGEVAAPTQGQAFFYFGPRGTKFAEIFVAHGFIVTPMEISE
jgi:phage N-6-adenine-methyltransferase